MRKPIVQRAGSAGRYLPGWFVLRGDHAGCWYATWGEALTHALDEIVEATA